jgi:hypothetical protein
VRILWAVANRKARGERLTACERSESMVGIIGKLFWTRFWHYGAIAFLTLVVAGVVFGATRPDSFEVGDPLHNSALISDEQQNRGKALRD